MNRNLKLLLLGAALAIAAAIPAIAIATGGDDAEQPITGEALERASQVALEHIGEGSVTDTEVGDEESYYEVEVTRDDGSEVDVQLDENFEVVGSEDESGSEEATDKD